MSEQKIATLNLIATFVCIGSGLLSSSRGDVVFGIANIFLGVLNFVGWLTYQIFKKNLE